MIIFYKNGVYRVYKYLYNLSKLNKLMKNNLFGMLYIPIIKKFVKSPS